MPTRLAVAVASVLLGLAALVPAAEAHRRGGGGFDPADSVLACIRSHEQGAAGYRTNTGNGYSGAYQSDRRFELAYAVKLIPVVHWETLGSDPSQRANTWHPLIQNEMSRNAIRARGLQPWPTPNRLCARTRR